LVWLLDLLRKHVLLPLRSLLVHGLLLLLRELLLLWDLLLILLALGLELLLLILRLNSWGSSNAGFHLHGWVSGSACLVDSRSDETEGDAEEDAVDVS
jgi:hypothetical protein